MFSFKTYAIAFSVLLDLVVLDQITKWYFSTYSEMITILPGMVHLTYVENPGIAFSLPLQGILLQITTLLFIGAMLYMMYRQRVWENIFLLYGSCFLIAGALGNAIDRLFRGSVVDFISIGTFPVFNLADTWVNVGVWTLLLTFFVLEQKKTPTRNSASRREEQ